MSDGLILLLQLAMFAAVYGVMLWAYERRYNDLQAEIGEWARAYAKATYRAEMAEMHLEAVMKWAAMPTHDDDLRVERMMIEHWKEAV